MKPEDQFHVGIVVDDLEASLDEYAALFGYEWCDEVHVEQQVLLAEGQETIEFQFSYSRSGPRIEVIQSQPGTLWTPAPGSGIHHLGYWSDDVASDGHDLEKSGWVMEAAGIDGSGSRPWAYHRSVHGPRIELVSLALRPLIEQMWTN